MTTENLSNAENEQPFAPDYASDTDFTELNENDAPLSLYETPTASLTFGSYTDEQPDFEQDEVLIPRLSLLQGQSQAVQDGIPNARPGRWYVTGQEEAVDTVHVVPLKFSYRQEYRPDRQNNFENLVCHAAAPRKSDLVGLGKFKGTACVECPLFVWTGGEEDDSPRQKPLCRGIISYIVYVKEYDTIAVLDFQSNAYKAGKTLNSAVMMRKLGKFVAKLQAGQKDTPQGKIWIPKITVMLNEAETVNAARAMNFA